MTEFAIVTLPADPEACIFDYRIMFDEYFAWSPDFTKFWRFPAMLVGTDACVDSMLRALAGEIRRRREEDRDERLTFANLPPRPLTDDEAKMATAMLCQIAVDRARVKTICADAKRVAFAAPAPPASALTLAPLSPRVLW